MKATIRRTESSERLEAEMFACEVEDDAELTLADLIDEVWLPADDADSDVFIRRDEFACEGCHLVLHRSRLVDIERPVCRDCLEWERRRAAA